MQFTRFNIDKFIARYFAIFYVIASANVSKRRTSVLHEESFQFTPVIRKYYVIRVRLACYRNEVLQLIMGTNSRNTARRKGTVIAQWKTLVRSTQVNKFSRAHRSCYIVLVSSFWPRLVASIRRERLLTSKCFQRI